MKRNIKCKLVFCFLLLFLFLGANFVFALEIDYPRIPGADPPQDFVKTAPSEEIPSLYVKYLFNLAIWIAGIIALGVLIYGGTRYLTSTGKPESMASAKDQITAAFFGFLLLLSSYLILSILNPQFIVLEIPKPEPVEVVEYPSVPSPPVNKLRTAINTELPFGTIIEKGIFEGTTPWEEEKRIPRIYNNAQITEVLANNLKEQSEDLYNYSYECTCRTTDPENPCGGNQSGNTTWKCDCGGCSATKPCTCDPCEKVRGDIQDAEQKNLENIYLGTEITYNNKSEEEVKITTSLTAEQIKTEEEVRLLRKQLNKLERVEKFMLECQLWPLESLAEFLYTKDYYISQKWPFRNVKFWEEILIEEDWATFYCPVSGTVWGGEYYTDIPIETLEIELPPVEPPETEIQMACTTEIPVGEIIDRTKRVTYKLIERMEELIELDKELIDAVDELQVLVNQCSSKRGCERRCTCFRCGCGSDPCIDRCQGWIYCCADDSSDYPEECLDRDEDTPCPYEELDAQIEKIRNIHQQITDAINGKEKEGEGEETSEEKIENIGIIPIIDDVIPKILEDLDLLIRRRMKECISDVPPEEEETIQPQVMISDCESAVRAVGPKGVVITNCCLSEEEFQECLALCYLSKGQDEYKQCLKDCFENQPEEISSCFHKINFFCCGE